MEDTTSVEFEGIVGKNGYRHAEYFGVVESFRALSPSRPEESLALRPRDYIPKTRNIVDYLLFISRHCIRSLVLVEGLEMVSVVALALVRGNSEEGGRV